MPYNPNIKSFNHGVWDDLAHAAKVLVVSAAVIALVLPHIFQFAIVPALQIMSPLIGAFGVDSAFPDIDPRWEPLSALSQALDHTEYGGAFRSILVLCIAFLVVLVVSTTLRGRRFVHDGTWLGPKRVPGDPGGSAYLMSRHSDLKRMLAPWDGKSAPVRSGLPVAYFGRKFWILDYVNALIYGAPGSGKSRRVLIPAICAHIQAGDSVFCLDPKGELGDFTEDYAKRHDYRVVRIMVDDPIHSPDTANPLDTAITFARSGDIDEAIAEVASIAKVICPTKSRSNPHFDDSARALCEGLLLVVVTDPGIPDEARNLATVNALASFPCADGSGPLERIRKMALALPSGHPAKSKLSQVANTGDEEASSIVSTFNAKLNDYADARVSKMLWKSSFRIEEMAQGKTIVYLSFCGAYGNYGKLVTTLVSSAISSLRREAARQGGHLSRECYLLLEEMAQLERVEAIYSDAGIMRGEGIHMLLVLQEKSQLLTKYSRDEAAALTGCCDDTLVLSVNELEVARELSGKIGTYPALMRTSSRAYGSGLLSRGRGGVTTASQRRDLIAPDELLLWGPETGNLLIGHGGVFALPSPGLENPFLNEALGLADRKSNDYLRMRKKAERPAVNDRPAPIWLPEDDEKKAPGADGSTAASRQNYNPLRR